MKIREQLLRKFSNFVYRHAYAEDFLDSYIATQIKVLREQRNLSQATLAKRLGMRQSQIARMESVNHAGWQIRTLKRVAKALDLFLVIKFESFGAALSDIESFSRPSLQRASFKDDPVFHERAALGPVDIDVAAGHGCVATVRMEMTGASRNFAATGEVNAA